MGVVCKPIKCPEVASPNCTEEGQELVNKSNGCCTTQTCGQFWSLTSNPQGKFDSRQFEVSLKFSPEGFFTYVLSKMLKNDLNVVTFVIGVLLFWTECNTTLCPAEISCELGLELKTTMGVCCKSYECGMWLFYFMIQLFYFILFSFPKNTEDNTNIV